MRDRRSAVRIQSRKNDPVRIDLNGENFLDIIYFGLKFYNILIKKIRKTFRASVVTHR